MKVAVLGLGKVGHNMAALLAARGFEVTGFTRDPEKAEAVNRFGITVFGALEGNFKVQATTDLSQAVDGARFLFVTTTSKGHRPMAELLRGKLQEGQLVVIFTGNWGAYEFYCVLGDEARTKRVVLGETSGNLAGSPSLTYPATTYMKPIKKHISFATIPGSAACQAARELRDAFPEFCPVDSIVDTSLNNTNPPVHVPISLFNITRMANREEASFYGECLPPMLQDLVMAADQERCQVIRALGGTPKSVLELMNSAWDAQCASLKELGQSNPSLQSVQLPKTPYHRFLTEDVPYGYLAVSRLGKRYGVATPRIDFMVAAYQFLLGEQADMTGPEFPVDLTEILREKD